jgi:predicted nucleic acid-binding Zn ribbon protein
MGNLGGTFEKRIKQLGIKKQVDASLIVQEAQEKIKEIFGEHGRDNLKVISYRNGVLKIAASSSAWAAECQGNINKVVKPPIQKAVFNISNQLNEY